MDLRKVQLTGSSSYVVTLPKEWITLNGIKKNDPVGVMVQPNGMLLITPKSKGEPPYRTKEFDVDEISDSTYLFRLLVSAYINGYSTIVLKSKTRIESFVRECAISFTQTAIGPEIIEESIKSITMKDLLNPIEMPMDKTIKRMHILVKTMHEDAIMALREKNRQLADRIEPRDRDVDRLNWLISRQFNILLTNMSLSNEMKMTREETTCMFLMSRLIERIGDHAVKISKEVILIFDEKIDPQIIEMITFASGNSLEILEDTIAAWEKKDIKAANKNIDSVTDLASYCKEINDAALNLNGVSSVGVSYIAESIRRSGEYAGDISGLLIDYLVNE